MKIVLTGSIGNIGKPLTQQLVQHGHHVTLITSSAERKDAIEALGATAAVGRIEDVDFLTSVFTGADIVYCMETLEAAGGFFSTELDYVATINTIVNNYKIAIERTGVKRVVHLSSIGAHMPSGNGILIFHYNAENILQQLPADVSIKFMRPVGFYYNLLSFIPAIKARGAIFTNRGGDTKEPWVSPLDIAAVIAEEMEKPFEGRTVRYIASEELSPNEVAAILGEAIGKPDLQWEIVSDEQVLKGMIAAGMNPKVAEGLIEMQAAQGNGVLYEHYEQNKPVLGTIKLRDFATDFAAAYTRS